MCQELEQKPDSSSLGNGGEGRRGSLSTNVSFKDFAMQGGEGSLREARS